MPNSYGYFCNASINKSHQIFTIIFWWNKDCHITNCDTNMMVKMHKALWSFQHQSSYSSNYGPDITWATRVNILLLFYTSCSVLQKGIMVAGWSVHLSLLTAGRAGFERWKLATTPWAIKRCHFYFYDNFDKCGPISIILSLLDS